MNQIPLVSVCVPTYNYARFLPDCVESVLQQTISDWERVITDDASSDQTEAIATQYAAADQRDSEGESGLDGLRQSRRRKDSPSQP
jgi:glycosyltransferase involved in cell wall biosynthesis